MNTLLRSCLLVLLAGCQSSQETPEVESEVTSDATGEERDVAELIAKFSKEAESEAPVALESSLSSADGRIKSGGVMRVKAFHLHVRSGPSETHSIVGYLRMGVQVKIITPGHWAEIKPGYWVNTNWLE